jgi:Flp pilus assembly protein TadG
MIPNCRKGRSGVAAVETSVVILPLFILLAGVWEVGRLMEAQQVLDNAAREGARAAASARTTDYSGNAIPYKANPSSYVYNNTAATASNTNEQGNDYPTNIVLQYIADAGYDISGIATPTIYKGSAYSASWDWQQQSTQGDTFTVTVQLATNKVRWIFLPNVINVTTTLQAKATWITLKDTQLTVSTNLGNN